MTIPSSPTPKPEPYDLEDRLKYITDGGVRSTVGALLKEIQTWDDAKIAVEPIKYHISLKVSGRVFGHVSPRRKHFVIFTYDEERKWAGFPIHGKEDLESAKALMRANMQRLA